MRGKTIAIEYCYTPEQIDEIRREAAIEERRRIKKAITQKWKEIIEDIKLTVGMFAFIMTCAIFTWFLL